MIETFIKAAIGISVILGGWLAVQVAWRKVCGSAPDEDALAGRLGCHGCDCHRQCKNDELGATR